jgi:hypothetical protein
VIRLSQEMTSEVLVMAPAAGDVPGAVDEAAVLAAAVAEVVVSKLRKQVNLKDTFNERSI